MKNILLIFTLFILSCTPNQEKISEAEVIKTIEGVFEAIDVKNEIPNLIDEYITDDFIIFEADKKMNKSEFIEFVSSFPMIESDWELSDFRIKTYNNTAHISLLNKGRFVMQTDSIKLLQKYEWLESAYMIKEGGKLKIKFYSSDNIKLESVTID
jgi:hypothetical protein